MCPTPTPQGCGEEAQVLSSLHPGALRGWRGGATRLGSSCLLASAFSSDMGAWAAEALSCQAQLPSG